MRQEWQELSGAHHLLAPSSRCFSQLVIDRNGAVVWRSTSWPCVDTMRGAHCVPWKASLHFKNMKGNSARNQKSHQ